jgi:hypothetical protein
MAIKPKPSPPLYGGKIVQHDDDQYTFSYNTNTDEFAAARREGFNGYPAFRLKENDFSNNVIDTFMKRLPPRKRRDFKTYLRNQCIPELFEVNNFVLMAHTGIKLPSDGFDLIPDLTATPLSFDYVTEIAGARYDLSYEDSQTLNLGSEVHFTAEPDNQYDVNAMQVFCGEKRIGYLN